MGDVTASQPLLDSRPPCEVIRVLLGHRGTLVRGALAALLSSTEGLEVVGEVARLEDVIRAGMRTRPHVVVLEHALPGAVAVSELCQALRQALPECRVLVVLERRSWVGAGPSLVRMAPWVGIIGTEATPADLVDGVRRLARGESVLDAELALAVLRSAQTVLTGRECAVLREAKRGATAREIAAVLGLSPGTVRNYLSRILTKLGARTRIEAVQIAQEAGWI